MDNEDYGYEFDEGSDIDNWEDEQVFQDHEGREEEWEEPDYDYNRDEAPEYEPQPNDSMEDAPHEAFEPREDFGYFGEMGMMED